MSFKHRLRQRYDYGHLQERNLTVREVGRHFGFHEVDMETWSTKSEEAIPSSCKIPRLNIPTDLPRSLHIDNWFDGGKSETISSSFKVKAPRPATNVSELYTSLRYVLTWANREDFKLCCSVDAVICCSALRSISLTPCHRRSAWEFAVYFYQNKLFIDSRERKPGEAEFLRHEDHEDTFGRWGKKFEDVIRHGDHQNNSYRGQDVDVRVNRIVTIGSRRILTTAKVSCQLADPDQEEVSNYIELKTHNELQNWQQTKGFNQYKSQKVWAHSALVGLQTVYFGLRTKEGELLEIRRHTTEELAQLGRNYWKPHQMLSFVDELLDWVSDISVEGLTYTLSYDGDDIIELTWDDHPDLRNVVQEKFPLMQRPMFGA